LITDGMSRSKHPDGPTGSLRVIAMPMLDPHKPDGVYDWRDGKRLVKSGEKLYIEGTDTLAGRHVHYFISPFSPGCAYPLSIVR
jgi:hypothetical protein